MRRSSLAALALAPLFSLACGGADDSAFGASGAGTTSGATTTGDVTSTGAGGAGGGGTSTGGASAGGGAPGEGTIAIYVKGDFTDPGFADGLSGQTPDEYVIALSRYHLLRAADDPSPVPCFDHGKKPVESDMTKDTLVGTCQTASIPSGLYTHGRTKVDWARYRVKGTYHAGKTELKGKFTFFRAYSDTTYEGKDYKASKGFVRFEGAVANEVPLDYPMPPDGPGVSFRLDKGELSMTFAYGKPLPIDQKNTDAHWARFNWKVFDAFRWEDQEKDGFNDGVWDVTMGGGEPVKMFGYSGYFVTTSID